MNTRELFKRRVIELIHGLPYKECIGKEKKDATLFTPRMENFDKHFYPITLGRVMQALRNKDKLLRTNLYSDVDGIFIVKSISDEIFWKLTEEDGQEYTDNNQTDETIEKLYQLIK